MSIQDSYLRKDTVYGTIKTNTRLSHDALQYWCESIDQRWGYMEIAISCLQRCAPSTILELGTHFLPLNSESFLIALKQEELVNEKGIVHDLNVFPYPFADKEFDCSVALQVLEHLINPRQVFTELIRISKRVLLSFPYLWVCESLKDCHSNITDKTISLWTLDVPPTKSWIVEGKLKRKICFWDENVDLGDDENENFSKTETENKFFIEIDYLPTHGSRWGRDKPVQKYINEILHLNKQSQLDFLSIIKNYKKDFSAIPLESNNPTNHPHWIQPWFHPLDGMSLYAMIASRKPKNYIEIGSGNSTKFAAKAISDKQLSTKIISIDPNPRAEIDRLCQTVIRTSLENVEDLVALFSGLDGNDIVFFDGSHRCMQNSDVTTFFLDCLPAIPEGVAIGIHDIFWPNDYPLHFSKRYYSEQYLLGAYMLGAGRRFSVIFSCIYMMLEFKSLLKECIEEGLFKQLVKHNYGISGATFWFRKLESLQINEAR